MKNLLLVLTNKTLGIIFLCIILALIFSLLIFFYGASIRFTKSDNKKSDSKSDFLNKFFSNEKNKTLKFLSIHLAPSLTIISLLEWNFFSVCKTFPKYYFELGLTEIYQLLSLGLIWFLSFHLVISILDFLKRRGKNFLKTYFLLAVISFLTVSSLFGGLLPETPLAFFILVLMNQIILVAFLGFYLLSKKEELNSELNNLKNK